MAELINPALAILSRNYAHSPRPITCLLASYLRLVSYTVNRAFEQRLKYSRILNLLRKFNVKLIYQRSVRNSTPRDAHNTHRNELTRSSILLLLKLIRQTQTTIRIKRKQSHILTRQMLKPALNNILRLMLVQTKTMVSRLNHNFF